MGYLVRIPDPDTRNHLNPDTVQLSCIDLALGPAELGDIHGWDRDHAHRNATLLPVVLCERPHSPGGEGGVNILEDVRHRIALLE